MMVVESGNSCSFVGICWMLKLCVQEQTELSLPSPGLSSVSNHKNKHIVVVAVCKRTELHVARVLLIGGVTSSDGGQGRLPNAMIMSCYVKGK